MQLQGIKDNRREKTKGMKEIEDIKLRQGQHRWQRRQKRNGGHKKFSHHERHKIMRQRRYWDSGDIKDAGDMEDTVDIEDTET